MLGRNLYCFNGFHSPSITQLTTPPSYNTAFPRRNQSHNCYLHRRRLSTGTQRLSARPHRRPPRPCTNHPPFRARASQESSRGLAPVSGTSELCPLEHQEWKWSQGGVCCWAGHRGHHRWVFDRGAVDTERECSGMESAGSSGMADGCCDFDRGRQGDVCGMLKHS